MRRDTMCGVFSMFVSSGRPCCWPVESLGVQ